MLSNDQWKTLMFCSVSWALHAGTITLKEANNLDDSVLNPIDELEMNRDTFRRLQKGKVK